MSVRFTRNALLYLCLAVLLIFLCWPTRFSTKYDFIPGEEILKNLIERTTRNITALSGGPQCDYTDLVRENLFLYHPPYTEQILNTYNIRLGGEYLPADCTPLYSTAVIVPYRDRADQLQQFLTYMHNFLRRQRLHYRIFVVEQHDPKPFNRAKLLNIGGLVAMRADFPCLVFHDVDLFPMTLGHLYACTVRPRHMSSALDVFRFNLPYYGLFGGVVAIESQTFLQVNGMSNMFSGWGGEDDDFYGRLEARNIRICRFAPDYGRYTMLKHAKETPNEDRLAFLRNGHLRYRTDGLNSLAYKEVAFKLHALYTHVVVET